MMTPEKPRSAAKGQSAYVIPVEVLQIFHQRKKEKGVLLTRSLVDALSFACRNREAWW